ncbi:lipopolysaccharide biosynthesis protein [Arcanobacterium pinnipediorum]|uniref:Membrane protein involved in the export of O-antigen and teichoic acid n=1 Tax=Arcanobacterium pinnipediorum TaxID=1503041 RepID=A0ABY5AGY1_9ACTO|nr:hypothetical protein [Arcanobacterium pinnipediorum]USR79464.1 hypothetical protein NG665_00245 [Arcanobacterium pinnipediorum]
MGAQKKVQAGMSVSIGAGIAALSGFAIIFISARVLSPSDNALFLSFWATLFFATGTLSGIQSEITRAVGSETIATPPPASATLTPYRITLSYGVIVSIIVAAIWLLSHSNDPLGPTLFTTAIMMIAVILYTGQVTTLGILGGLRNWLSFGMLNSAEALLRLASVFFVAFTIQTSQGFAAATVLGFSAWIFFSYTRQLRRALRTRIALPARRLAKNILSAIASAGATALLINGFPTLMLLTTPAAEFSQSSDLILAVSVTRAPLLVPLFAFQSVIISYYLGSPEKRRSTTKKIFGGVFAFTIILAPVVALFGTDVMSFVFGPAYANSALTLTVLAIDAALLALLVLGGTITIALNRYKECLIGWYSCAAGALAILLLPLPLEVRTLLALTISPLIGISIHFKTILRP